MVSGPFAGYPVVDVTVALYDGSYHDVDSSDIAFQEAGRVAFKEGFLRAAPHLLEPIMDVEVVTPEEFMGGCTGSIAQRRGRIETMDSKGNQKIIRAKVPLSEMFGYANHLRTLTQGRAAFSMEFEHYEPVPAAIAAEIVEKRREQKKVR
jgi:elongation factor G